MHLLVRLVMVTAAQVRATFLTLMDDLDTNGVDCICSPPLTSGAVIRRLPKSSWFFHLLCVGALSVLMSLLILRTITYGAIIGSEPAPKLKPSILQKVLGASSNTEESDESLQESLEALTEEEEDSWRHLGRNNNCSLHRDWILCQWFECAEDSHSGGGNFKPKPIQ